MAHVTSGSPFPPKNENISSEHRSGKELWLPPRQEHFPEWMQNIRLPSRKPGQMGSKNLPSVNLIVLSNLNQSRQAWMESRVSHSQPVSLFIEWRNTGGTSGEDSLHTWKANVLLGVSWHSFLTQIRKEWKNSELNSNFGSIILWINWFLMSAFSATSLCAYFCFNLGCNI